MYSDPEIILCISLLAAIARGRNFLERLTRKSSVEFSLLLLVSSALFSSLTLLQAADQYNGQPTLKTARLIISGTAGVVVAMTKLLVVCLDHDHV